MHIQQIYGIDCNEEAIDAWYPRRICKGCTKSISRHVEAPERYHPPKLGILGKEIHHPQLRAHNDLECKVCLIYRGNIGRPKSAAPLYFQEDFGFSDYPNDVTNPELNEKLSPVFKKVCWKARDTPPKCSKCFSSVCIGHECTRIASVQYAIDSLERKGIADEVVAVILKKRAEKAKSAEILVDRLNVRLLNGEFGSNPPSTRIDDESIIELKVNLGLSENKLHILCQWLKGLGIKTPSVRGVFSKYKSNTEDLFSQTTVLLQQKHTSDSGERQFLKKETEVVHCHDIEQLLSRCESARGRKPIIYRWGCDHGRGYLKFIVQPTYEIEVTDSVKSCFLIAIADAPETRYNLEQIIRLLPKIDLTNRSNVFTADLKVLSLVCGVKGGAACYPCPYCTYCWTTEEKGYLRNWGHFLKMYNKLQTEYQGCEKSAKYCCGVECLPLLEFDNPLDAFPIASVHAQLGLREKLIDKIAKELLGEKGYSHLQKEWIIPLVGPPLKFHGGSYTGRDSVKLIDSFDLIDVVKFPLLQYLVPVLKAASKLIHCVFGKELKSEGFASISEFRSAYLTMRKELREIDLTDSSLLYCNIGMDEISRLTILSSRMDIITRPTPKIHFLTEHLETFLKQVNSDGEIQKGIGYYSEQVLESCHQNFLKFSSNYTSGDNKLLRSVIMYNAEHLSYIDC